MTTITTCITGYGAHCRDCSLAPGCAVPAGTPNSRELLGIRTDKEAGKDATSHRGAA